MSSGVRLRGRTHTYTLLVGMVVGMLGAGLAVPAVFGDRLPSAASGASFTTDGLATSATPGTTPGVSVPTTAGTAGTSSTGATTGPEALGAGPAGAAPALEVPGAAGGGLAPDGTALTASDVGVTPESVRLGFALYDLGPAGAVGLSVAGVDPAAEEEAIQAYVDHFNDEGGINGRLIDPVYEAYDVLDDDDIQAACLALTEDAQSFAVLGDLLTTGAQCVARTGTPNITNSAALPDELYAENPGLVFGTFPRGGRIMDNWADQLNRLGLLAGQDVGILTDAGFDTSGSATARLVAAVERDGGTVVRATRLPADLGQGSSQIPVEVNQMRTGGADVVLLGATFLYSQQFAQQADSQQWVPTYSVSDWAGMYTQVTSQNMPPSYDGSIGFTSTRTGDDLVGVEAEKAALCRQIYEERTGHALAQGTHDYAMVVCDLLFLFVQGARTAGPALTRASLAAGMGQISSFVSAFWGGGSFNGKTDLSDLVRLQQWSSSCRCYRPVSDFISTRY